MKSDQKQKKLWPFFYHLLAPYKLQMVGAFIALTVAAMTVLAIGWGVKELVDVGLSQNNGDFLNKSLLILIVVVGLLASASYGRYYLVSWVGEHIIADLRKKIYQHIISLPPSFFEVNKTGEIISRITTDTSVLQSVVSQSIPVAFRNSFMLAGGLIMLCFTSWKLTLTVLFVVPLVVAPMIVFGRIVRVKSRESQDRIGDISGYVDETLHAIRTVQAFGYEAQAHIQFTSYTEGALSTAIEYIKARAALTAFVIFVVFGSICVVLWQGGHDVLSGNITAGELSAFIFYAVLVASSAGALSEVGGALQRAAGASERLVELMSHKCDIGSPVNPVILKQPIQGVITFENVTFNYPTRPDKSSLKNISLVLKESEKVAFVGPSGAGKTTLFQLLLRFYDMQKGRILLDGQNINALDLHELRGCFGFVSQDPVIFSESVVENIRFGSPEASLNQVKEAARIAYADQFIEELPGGYNAILGEKGCLLSGGQKQRIAIARAVLRNPKILLLDEATSALDADSEEKVQKALENVMKNRTTLIIAHRLSTVQNADRIVVLEHGKIVESGTHYEMIQKDGLYAHLANLQLDLKS